MIISRLRHLEEPTREAPPSRAARIQRGVNARDLRGGLDLPLDADGEVEDADPRHTILVTLVPRRSLKRVSRRMWNSVAYSRISRECLAGSHLSVRIGFRIRRREIGALSTMAPAAGVSGMLKTMRRRLSGGRNDRSAAVRGSSDLASLELDDVADSQASLPRKPHRIRAWLGRPLTEAVDFLFLPDDLGAIGSLVEARDAVQVVDRNPLGVTPSHPARQNEPNRLSPLVSPSHLWSSNRYASLHLAIKRSKSPGERHLSIVTYRDGSARSRRRSVPAKPSPLAKSLVQSP